ncbi:hypothetical protein PINS_up002478 [Pythium insidiosum]|nr:hypothetical protein PINS_up002478 [Pythium insidiosum]
MGTPLALEGDGLITNLFHFLWSKDDFGEGPQLFIPHTIVYRFTQPSAWFFTSLKTGKIKRKNKVNINNAQIEHEFTKHLRRHGLTTGASGAGSSDIVATYLYQIPAARERERGRKAAAAAADSKEPSATTIIEYLDAKGLHDFLMTREKTYDGILQRFVLPKGTSNATIRAIWSPKICLLERRVNRKNLFDKRFSVYERGVTFDGGGAGELFSRPEPVRGAMLPGEVQLLCEKIVDHVTQVSYHKYRISRMVLHLKTDADDRLWLLWCSSLRVLHASAAVSVTDAGLSMSQRLRDSESVRPLDIVSDAQVPDHVSLGRVPHPSSATTTTSPGGKASTSSASRSKLRIEDRDAPLRDGFQRCTSCAAVVEQHRLLSTTYKAVLEHFQRFLLFLWHRVNDVEQAAIEWPPDERLVQAAGGVGFGILPFIDRSAASSSGSLSSPSLSPQSSSTSLRERDLIIPPVIQFLHPLLSVSDFERHRSDPIFQHKPVAVCESCCLVYSDFSTSALEPNTLRPNAPAILRPQREVSELKSRVDALDPIGTTLPSTQPQHRALSPTQRPPPSAWKPIPAQTAKPRLQKLTKSSTLQSLPRAPTLPERIDSLAEFRDRTSSWSPNAGTTSQSNQHTDTTSVNAREEAFFRELYHQQGVLDDSDAHPLQHVLESSAKLAQVSAVQKAQLKAVRKGVQSMSSLSSSTSYAGLSSTMAAVDQVLEAAHERERKAKNPYAVAQTLPKDPLSRKRRSKPRQPRASRSPGSPSTEAAASATPQSSPSPSKRTNAAGSPPARRFISSRETRASELHQDFLFAALQDAQRQLEDMESLASIMLLDTTAPEMQENETETMAKEPMATADELAALLSENATLDVVVPVLEEPSTAQDTPSQHQEQEQEVADDGSVVQDSEEIVTVSAHADPNHDGAETAIE